MSPPPPRGECPRYDGFKTKLLFKNKHIWTDKHTQTQETCTDTHIQTTRGTHTKTHAYVQKSMLAHAQTHTHTFYQHKHIDCPSHSEITSGLRRYVLMEIVVLATDVLFYLYIRAPVFEILFSYGLYLRLIHP